MKKLDKKGFTLIELLAVIVILAIIMVIAVPQILNVIDKSKESAWESNIKMIEDGIETNETLVKTGMTNDGAVSVLSTAGCTKDNIAKSADIDANGTDISASFATNTCTITATGKNNFAGRTATITCTSTGCKHNK